MTIVCGLFTFKSSFFDGQSARSDCHATNQQHFPVDQITSGAINVSFNMASCMKFGFAVHLMGIFADTSMAIRVRSVNMKFRLYALVAVSVYTVLVLGWIIWLHFVRYNTYGKVCSGDYLETNLYAVQDGFAIRQG
jgi:hypothetical protein